MKPQTKRRVRAVVSWPWRKGVEALSALWRWADVDAREALFLVGLVLLAAGFWWAWPPLGLIVPGFVLVLYTIQVAR